MCIQDAFLFNGRPRKLPSGTVIYSSSSKNCHIILLNPSLVDNQVLKLNHSIFINLTFQNSILTFGCQYSPPSADLAVDLQLLDHSSLPFHKNVFLFGDLNAHSPLWGYPSQDHRRTSLINFTIKHSLIIINDPLSLPTFELPHIRGWPDVSLASPSAFRLVSSWEVKDFHDDDHSLLGDHRPIHIQIDQQVLPLPKRRFRTSGVPLSNFSKDVQTAVQEQQLMFENIITTDSFDMQYEILLNIITESANKNLKK